MVTPMAQGGEGPCWRPGSKNREAHLSSLHCPPPWIEPGCPGLQELSSLCPVKAEPHPTGAGPLPGHPCFISCSLYLYPGRICRRPAPITRQPRNTTAAPALINSLWLSDCSVRLGGASQGLHTWPQHQDTWQGWQESVAPGHCKERVVGVFCSDGSRVGAAVGSWSAGCPILSRRHHCGCRGRC